MPLLAALNAYGLGAGHYGRRWLGRVQGLPSSTALALRNTFRRPGRVALTQITLIVAGTEREIFLRDIPADTQFFTPELTAGRHLDPRDDHALLLNQKLTR